MARGSGGGKLACAARIRRQEDNATHVFVLHGRPTPPALEALGFDFGTCEDLLGEDPYDAPLAVAVHTVGDELVCAMARGCKCVRDSASLCLLCLCPAPWFGQCRIELM
ncbi:hypothetical protein ZWY2020_039054 [Hordeum vulgare]|nr:hypothetical protein ZWY2020_039054 [Hordeum vulgare]